MRIQLKGVSFSYPSQLQKRDSVLENIDLTIPDGTCTGIIGREGAGKTTMIGLLGTLLRPEKGQVFVDGLDVWGEPSWLPHVRRMIGFSFQFPEHQFLALTVGEEISARLQVSDNSEIAANLLRDVGLDPTSFLHRSPFTLSMGEARRITIATAFALRPATLLFDEPTVGLDGEGLDMLVRGLLQEAGRGTTIILATHDLDLLAEVASNIVVLSDKTVSVIGEKELVLTNEGLLNRNGYELPESVQVTAVLAAQGKIPSGNFNKPSDFRKLLDPS
jgi:energy-coupling factor transport system ATP-binding protein